MAAPDPRIAIEEQLDCLAQMVRSGAARYIGLANHPAWRRTRGAVPTSE